MSAPVLRTGRLVLRPWREADLEPFAALNADPEVMRYMPATFDRAASDATAARIRAHFDEHGFGLWAVEVLAGPERPSVAFAGFVGLQRPGFEAPFTPCVEVGWRLARAHQGRGIATEAARAAVGFGFEALGLDEILSFTVPANRASRRVMEKLAMTHHPAEDFDHPALPAEHPLRRHVLYRLRAEDWRAAGGRPPLRWEGPASRSRTRAGT